MSGLGSWILAAMISLVPARNHERLASAIESVALSEPPLFKGDDDRLRTASVIIAVGFREGSLIADVVGDRGRSFCTMQVHVTSGGGPALLTDPELCIRRGLTLLRESLRVCPKAPIAWYAVGGVEACSNDRAQRISRDRMAIAKRLLAVVVVP
jgi:hypothetical protein